MAVLLCLSSWPQGFITRIRKSNKAYSCCNIGTFEHISISSFPSNNSSNCLARCSNGRNDIHLRTSRKCRSRALKNTTGLSNTDVTTSQDKNDQSYKPKGLTKSSTFQNVNVALIKENPISSNNVIEAETKKNSDDLTPQQTGEASCRPSVLDIDNIKSRGIFSSLPSFTLGKHMDLLAVAPQSFVFHIGLRIILLFIATRFLILQSPNPLPSKSNALFRRLNDSSNTRGSKEHDNQNASTTVTKDSGCFFSSVQKKYYVVVFKSSRKRNHNKEMHLDSSEALRKEKHQGNTKDDSSVSMTKISREHQISQPLAIRFENSKVILLFESRMDAEIVKGTFQEDLMSLIEDTLLKKLLLHEFRDRQSTLDSALSEDQGEEEKNKSQTCEVEGTINREVNDSLKKQAEKYGVAAPAVVKFAQAGMALSDASSAIKNDDKVRNYASAGHRIQLLATSLRVDSRTRASLDLGISKQANNIESRTFTIIPAGFVPRDHSKTMTWIEMYELLSSCLHKTDSMKNHCTFIDSNAYLPTGALNKEEERLRNVNENGNNDATLNKNATIKVQTDHLMKSPIYHQSKPNVDAMQNDTPPKVQSVKGVRKKWRSLKDVAATLSPSTTKAQSTYSNGVANGVPSTSREMETSAELDERSSPNSLPDPSSQDSEAMERMRQRHHLAMAAIKNLTEGNTLEPGSVDSKLPITNPDEEPWWSRKFKVLYTLQMVDNHSNEDEDVSFFKINVDLTGSKKDTRLLLFEDEFECLGFATICKQLPEIIEMKKNLTVLMINPKSLPHLLSAIEMSKGIANLESNKIIHSQIVVLRKGKLPIRPGMDPVTLLQATIYQAAAQVALSAAGFNFGTNI